jgi:hypothetical protein
LKNFTVPIATLNVLGCTGNSPARRSRTLI